MSDLARDRAGEPVTGVERVPLSAVELLVAVDDHGSLSAAARALGITQPSASAGMRRLERRTGLALVTRGARGTVLTTEGRRLVPRARELLRVSDALEADVAAARGAHADRIVVAASLTIAEHLVPVWLARRGASSTVVDLVVANSRDVERSVLSGEADLGFVEAPHVDERLQSRVVGTDELVVVVAPGHPWARRRRPVSAHELATATLAMREVGSGTRDTLEQALRRVGETMPGGAGGLGSTVAVKNTVRAGRHVAVLSQHAVTDEIARGTLHRVEVDGVDLRRELRLVWPRGRRPSPAAQEFARIALGDRPRRRPGNAAAEAGERTEDGGQRIP